MHQRVCLIHGAATTSAVWTRVLACLPEHLTVSCPDRPCSGNLDIELESLAEAVSDSVVVGVSGGATLCLELAARGAAFRVAVAHEPAVGSLLPGLLAPMAAAFADGGVEGFARALYGPSWAAELAPADPGAVGRDLRMFRSFEPRPPAAGAVLLSTVGELSPPVRHEAAARLSANLGVTVQELPGAGHAVHLDRPEVLAALIVELCQ